MPERWGEGTAEGVWGGGGGRESRVTEICEIKYFFIVLLYVRPSSALVGNNAGFGERLPVAARWGCRIRAPSTIWPFLSVLESVLLRGYAAPFPLFITAANPGKTQANPSICTLERREIINGGFTGSVCSLLGAWLCFPIFWFGVFFNICIDLLYFCDFSCLAFGFAVLFSPCFYPWFSARSQRCTSVWIKRWKSQEMNCALGTLFVPNKNISFFRSTNAQFIVLIVLVLYR